MLTVGSLFAGIGGFDLAAERVGFTVKWQVEIDDYCTRVLERHWPHVRRYRDIRECGAHNLERVDLVCGGFPCQDVSYAGPGGGLDGERSGLWTEMRRVVCELRPRYVVVENVAALLDRGLGAILGELAACGYDAEWCCFSTGRRMGHERERVFIVADLVRAGLQEWRDTDADGTDAPCVFTRERFARYVESVDPRQKWADRPLLGRGVHGIPHRVDRVSALGNAVNPDVAECIFTRIKEAEAERRIA